MLWWSHCSPYHAACVPHQQNSGPLFALHRRERLCQKGKADPWLSAPVPVQSHPPFKCIVCIAGIRPGASVADTLLTKKLQTPSLHIIGSRDYVNKVSNDLHAPVPFQHGCSCREKYTVHGIMKLCMHGCHFEQEGPGRWRLRSDHQSNCVHCAVVAQIDGHV